MGKYEPVAADTVDRDQISQVFTISSNAIQSMEEGETDRLAGPSPGVDTI
jgi:hypothetical protein